MAATRKLLLGHLPAQAGDGAGRVELFLHGCWIQVPNHVAHGSEGRTRRRHDGHEHAHLGKVPQHT
eukprot:9863122-Alexandrium_andersonii.AAC.1